MDALKKVREVLDSLPWLITLLLVIFVDFVYGGIYRLCRGDVAGIVFGIIWFVTGGIFGIGWIIDVITVIFKKKITVLA